MTAYRDIFYSFSIEITVFLIAHFFIFWFLVLLNTYEKNLTLSRTGSFKARTLSKHRIASCSEILTTKQISAIINFSLPKQPECDTFFGLDQGDEIDEDVGIVHEFGFAGVKKVINSLRYFFIGGGACHIFQGFPLESEITKLKENIGHLNLQQRKLNKQDQNNCIFKILFKMSSLRFPQPQPTSNNSLQLGQQLLNAFQIQKQQIHKMKEQNRILTSLNEKVMKKDEEIQQLQKLVKRYKKSYDEYELIKATLNQKVKQFDRLAQQNKILFTEMNRVMAENKQLQEKLLSAQKIKHEFIKQRNASDARIRGIEETFRQYQQQCKSKQRELLKDLQKSYQQNKELTNKVEDLHTVKFQNEQLKAKITNFNSPQLEASEPRNGEMFNYEQQQNSQNRTQNISTFIQPNPLTFHSQVQNNPRNLINFSKSRQKSPNKSNSRVYDPEASAEIDRLRRQLVTKQMQLQRSKSLNHELSIEFDKSVSKICEFEKQLSMYRKQNHELKKTLSLFVQKQQYQKMHKNKLKNHEEEESSEQDDDQDQNTGRYSQISDSRR